MRSCFADLHVHIGGDDAGHPVKITASRSLTFANIAQEAVSRKGLDMVGIVDCECPNVQEDIFHMLESGDMRELDAGGILYKGRMTVILGAEVETSEADGRGAHYVSYFPDMRSISDYSSAISKYITNVNLSTQRSRLKASEVVELTHKCGGITVVAHAFTPFKSLYGACADRISELIDRSSGLDFSGVELGLSSDTFLADRISELEGYTFLSNSDAHSLSKMGREYNRLCVEEPSYDEFRKCLLRQDGRRVDANYGLDPRLGKYHHTFCSKCDHIFSNYLHQDSCPFCGARGSLVKGVFDRIEEIADRKEPLHPAHRPAYHHQVPLEFVPRVGKGTLNRLLSAFGTEMNVLHLASLDDLKAVVKDEVAENIVAAREGRLGIASGGGGIYGKVTQ